MKVQDVLVNLVVVATGAAAFLWMVQPVFYKGQAKETSHPVRVYERDVETLVYGQDVETEFVPGIYTGGLVISPEEVYYNFVELMARVVEAEAGNQNLLGKRMVVDVILNRVRDEDFPDTIVDVIFEENAFAVIGNEMYEQVEVSEETWTAVHMELEEISYPGLFYFCSTGFHEYGTPWNKIGDHYFNTK
mgnify:CR=1 FL=1